MWIHNIDPTLVHLGPLEIRWYGIAYVLGFFIAVWWLNYLRKKGKFPLKKDEIWDLAFYLLLGVIIGARLFMIFWEPQIYLKNPLNLLKIWQGGMSFHGGLVGIITAGYYYSKKKKISFLKLADMLSFPTMFALALGRVANFINGELVGRVTNSSICVVFPGFDECRHPSTLYAALKRFLVAGWLLWLTLRTKYAPGFIFWNFIFWEGVGRFIVDFYREDTLYAGLSLGQWFSLLMIIVGIYVFIKKYRKDWIKVLSRV
ncbi:prolipoprotein diacylglyceryl transferase [Candidatus Woesearchaeota archaeon]|jgi:phosphatidylglycerol---prolipoprotein diacylglyceryl transferase|nr:prolipoprotein diacylglyceryl transferase [Candidatus Woesearchaeota archaeon]MBT5739472.1 prolipoprotein diacylglyceryl transferase [Candidatus Woesearchaeota archaeon]